jgi:hypothetical protein
MTALLPLLLLASPAAADDYLTFQSPSGNIHCGLYHGNGETNLRCDLRELTPSYTRPPANCDADWGAYFALNAGGKGFLACVSDSMIDPTSPVLPYGEAVSLGGISCVSAKTGLTCTNGEGHGFSVAKARQKLF